MKTNLVKVNKGFTLIELLVVIAIIAILSTIGLTLFNGAQQNARDARRKSDIDAIAAALEGKRSPGTVSYSVISGTDFSAGAVPADSTTAQYCIRLYTGTDDAKSATGAMSNAWLGNGAGAAGTVCPVDAQLNNTGALGWRQALTTSNNGFDSAVFVANTYKSYVLCARLENTTASPNYYCRYSAQ